MRRLALLRSGTTQHPRVDTASSDAALIVATATDPAAFGFLFDRYFDDVFRFCYYRTGDWHLAEDLASQVFTIALASLDRFEVRTETDSFRGWLLGIARNLVGKSYRRDERHPTTPLDDALDFAGPADSVETMVLDAERRDQLVWLLEQLPENQRELIELRLAGFSATQIGEQMGKSPEAIRKAQSRAIFTLRDLLAGETATESEARRG